MKARSPCGEFRHATRTAYGIARFRLLSSALRVLPLQTSYALARWHGRRYYARRRDGFQNRGADMARRLGISAEQADFWLQRYYELASSDQLDQHLFVRMSVDEIDSLIEIRGLHHLDTALDAGRGAIIFSGHVWGRSTLHTALALRGYPLSILGFPGLSGDEARVIARVHEYRKAFLTERLGVQMLRMREKGVANKVERALAANRVITVAIDQSRSRPKVAADFLGDVGYFPAGYARLAARAGAPLLHYWLHREPDRWVPQVAEIGPPYHARDGVELAVRHCAGQIECSIRTHPPTWATWLFRQRLVWEQTAEPTDRIAVGGSRG